jgi:hypothetical protein
MTGAGIGLIIRSAGSGLAGEEGGALRNSITKVAL